MMTTFTNIPIRENAKVREYKCRALMADVARKQIDIINNHDYHNPTPEEDVMNKEAVMMLTYIAALDYFIYDLIDEMESVGKYRQGNKHNINRAKELILHAHEVFYRKIYNDDFRGCKAYNEAMETFYAAINECVLLEAPERAYNIIVAIVRLQAECRSKIAARYFYAPSRELDKIPSMLEGLGITDYHLDNIIDKGVRPIIMNVKRVG